jgi:hypothetical protein
LKPLRKEIIEEHPPIIKPTPIIMIEPTPFTEIEFATIQQDFIMTVAEICHEANLKLLILNANERQGTLRVQFLFEKNNGYALKAIGNIQKIVSVQNEYYYFS